VLPDSHPVAQSILSATGQAHDGDTFRLNTGQNGRLYGVDAFELNQRGQAPNGSFVNLGQMSRSALLPFVTPDATVTGTGSQTYNRPVVALSLHGQDAGRSLLDQGLGVVTPQYLKGDPTRFFDYVQANRLARLNRRGAYADTFQTPSSFRHGQPDPWAKPNDPHDWGNSSVYFWDEPTPPAGLADDVASGYLKIWHDPKATADDIIAYGKAHGFNVDAEDARRKFAFRDKGGSITDNIPYNRPTPPRVLTDPGDGSFGSFMRGVADPFNVLDEGGAVVDSVLPNALYAKGQERENVWSSPRRFGDIYWNNLEQNRAILDHDEQFHPWARTGGQLAGGLVIPGASVEGLGATAFREAVEAGAGEYAARNIARRAVVNRLGTVGAVEGGAAGFGGGEDWGSRTKGALLGAPSGYALGVGAGYLAPHIAAALGRPFNRLVRREGEAPAQPFAGASATMAENDIPPPPEGFTEVSGAELPAPFAHPATEAMASELERPTLEGPSLDEVPAPPEGFSELPPDQAQRIIDRIDVNVGRTRPLLDPATEMERRAAAQRIQPGDVLPLPANSVGSMGEAERIGAGRLAPVRAPNETDALGRRNVPSPVDASRTIPKRGPLDLVTWLRAQGGIKPQGGELAHYGITNAPRQGVDFAGGEGRFGKLVDPDRGMPLDEAAQRAWEAGYFPDHVERPTVAEFLDTLHATHTGRNRAFVPEDYPEVDAFNAARQQRYRVEAASDRGAPLVEDHGQPIDMADLDANAPPAEAYHEWGENAPNLAGNVRLDKLDSPQAIKRALTQVENVTGGFDAARRGRITHAETEALASDLNMTPQELLGRRQGQAFNAEQALAARQILAKSGNELVNMARRLKRAAAAGEASPADLARFREAIVRHAAIQEQVSGATAEAGRALQQFRMTADSRNVRGDVLKRLLDEAGGEDGIINAADAVIENAADPKKLNADTKVLAKPKFKDKAIELWYNSLLSGPRTHLVNITSNLLTSLAQIPEHGVAAGVGAVRKMIPSQRETERVLFSEMGARTVGMLQGAREGFAEFGRTMRTGTTRDFVTKVEAQETQAIGGRLGKAIRTPTRLLSAEDEFFKAIARRSEIVGLAVRKARAEGLSGQAATARANELAKNPTPEMIEQAFDYGRYVTFQRPLGAAGNTGVAFLQKAWPLKLFVPFVRTPTNLLKFAVERSPAAPALWKWSRDFQAGGARRDLAIARWLVGSSAMMMAVDAARNGLVTGGGPADDSAKRLLYADGWQPYSVRVGGRYYSYGRLDPFSTTIGLAADWVDLQDHMTDSEREKVATLLVGSTLQNLSSKTWLSGITNLADAMNDPGRYGQNAAAKLASSVAVPALVAQSAQVVDPFQRDAQGIMDRIKSRIPGVSRSLPPRRDVLGNPIDSANSGGLDAFSPIFTSTRRNDPVANALLNDDIHLSMPSRTVNKAKLSPQQYDAYQQWITRSARPSLDALVADPGWPLLPRDDKQDAVDKIMRDARKSARTGMFGARPNLSTVPPPPPGFTITP
jgi:endonuclease YncB( thermonuclease family)